MAERKKPTRRKRQKRSESNAAAEHAGVERTGGTAQHSMHPRPSVNDSKHGLFHRRNKDAAKPRKGNKGKSSVTGKPAIEASRVPADKTVATQAVKNKPVTAPEPKPETSKPVVASKSKTSTHSTSVADSESRGSLRTSAAVRATAQAIETQIPSISSDLASLKETLPTISEGSKRDDLQPVATSEAGSASKSASVAGAAARSTAAPISSGVTEPSFSKADSLSSNAKQTANDAESAAGSGGSPAAGASATETSTQDAPVATVQADDGKDESTKAASKAATGKSSKPGKQRPSFTGKRATGPDIVDHVKARARRKRHRRKILIIVLIIAAIVAVIGGLFAWQRWFRYDDAADIQGTWQLDANKKQAVVIDDTHIDLVKGLAYSYTLNTQDKTISFTFNNETGSGSYHFNGDRTMLVIREGGERPNILVQLGLQEDPAIQDDTMKDNVTVLTKVSDDTTAHYKGREITQSTKSKSSSASGGSSSSSDSASTTSQSSDSVSSTGAPEASSDSGSSATSNVAASTSEGAAVSASSSGE